MTVDIQEAYPKADNSFFKELAYYIDNPDIPNDKARNYAQLELIDKAPEFVFTWTTTQSQGSLTDEGVQQADVKHSNDTYILSFGETHTFNHLNEFALWLARHLACDPSKAPLGWKRLFKTFHQLRLINEWESDMDMVECLRP